MKNYVQKYLVCALLVMGYTKMHAQQQPNFLLFESNMSIINPAYTGVNGALLGLHYRTAWMGVEDAPRMASFNYHSRVKNKASWGINFLSDQIYVENQGYASIDYSYRLDVSETTKLRLGIKAGGMFNNIDVNKLNRVVSENNPTLTGVNNYINPLIGLGAYLENDHNFFGISIPNILNTKRYKEIEGVQTTATDRPHVYISGGLNIGLYKEDLSFRPVMLYRVVKDAPSLLTVMAKLDYKDAVEFGVGLTNNDYMSASFLIKGYNNLDLGLGYEFAQRKGLASLRENTMEFVLRYRFENKANNDTRSQAEATND